MILATNNHFYITVLVIIALCFLYILIFYTLIPLIKNSRTKKELISYLNENNITYEINKSNAKQCDFILKVNGTDHLVKLVDVKKNSDIKVNADKTFFMYYKTITTSLKSKELVDLKEFITLDNKNKIVLFNNLVNEISVYKNEKEVYKLEEKQSINNTIFIDKNKFNNIIK